MSFLQEELKGDLPNIKDLQNYRNQDGDSLVHMACREDNLVALQKLLNNGCSATCTNNKGESPLHISCQQSVALSQLWMKEQITENSKDRIYYQCVKLLLKSEGQTLIKIRDNDLRSALHVAARGGDPKLTKILLHYKIQPNWMDKDGKTAFEYVPKEFSEVRQLLKDYTAIYKKGFRQSVPQTRKTHTNKIVSQQNLDTQSEKYDDAVHQDCCQGPATPQRCEAGGVILEAQSMYQQQQQVNESLQGAKKQNLGISRISEDDVKRRKGLSQHNSSKDKQQYDYLDSSIQSTATEGQNKFPNDDTQQLKIRVKSKSRINRFSPNQSNRGPNANIVGRNQFISDPKYTNSVLAKQKLGANNRPSETMKVDDQIQDSANSKQRASKLKSQGIYDQIHTTQLSCKDNENINTNVDQSLNNSNRVKNLVRSNREKIKNGISLRSNYNNQNIDRSVSKNQMQAKQNLRNLPQAPLQHQNIASDKKPANPPSTKIQGNTEPYRLKPAGQDVQDDSTWQSNYLSEAEYGKKKKGLDQQTVQDQQAVPRPRRLSVLNQSRVVTNMDLKYLKQDIDKSIDTKMESQKIINSVVEQELYKFQERLPEEQLMPKLREYQKINTQLMNDMEVCKRKIVDHEEQTQFQDKVIKDLKYQLMILNDVRQDEMVNKICKQEDQNNERESNRVVEHPKGGCIAPTSQSASNNNVLSNDAQNRQPTKSGLMHQIDNLNYKSERNIDNKYSYGLEQNDILQGCYNEQVQILSKRSNSQIEGTKSVDKSKKFPYTPNQTIIDNTKVEDTLAQGQVQKSLTNNAQSSIVAKDLYENQKGPIIPNGAHEEHTNQSSSQINQVLAQVEDKIARIEKQFQENQIINQEKVEELQQSLQDYQKNVQDTQEQLLQEKTKNKELKSKVQKVLEVQQGQNSQKGFQSVKDINSPRAKVESIKDEVTTQKSRNLALKLSDVEQNLASLQDDYQYHKSLFSPHSNQIQQLKLNLTDRWQEHLMDISHKHQSLETLKKQLLQGEEDRYSRQQFEKKTQCKFETMETITDELNYKIDNVLDQIQFLLNDPSIISCEEFQSQTKDIVKNFKQNK